jgi:hypothetical protein
MVTIRTKAELVELLFEELDESEPQQEVDPSFLLRVGGLCHGLIYGGFEGNPLYLEDTFSDLPLLWWTRLACHSPLGLVGREIPEG